MNIQKHKAELPPFQEGPPIINAFKYRKLQPEKSLVLQSSDSLKKKKIGKLIVQGKQPLSTEPRRWEKPICTHITICKN